MNVIAENRAMREEILAAISAVIEHGQFMLGGEVDAFEAEAARYLGMRHVIGLNSGTDALLLALNNPDDVTPPVTVPPVRKLKRAAVR